MASNEIEEEQVDAGVVAQFGVEGGGEDVVLADEDGVFFTGGEGFDSWAGAADAWGADEDHLEWAAGEFGVGVEDGGVDLASVGVAFDCDVEGVEGLLRGVGDVFGEEDDSGAGAEGGSGVDEGLEDVEEAALLEEFEHRGGLSAGHDEAVDAFEVRGETDEFRSYAEHAQGCGVGFVCSLKGENADCYLSSWCCRHVLPLPKACKVFYPDSLGLDFGRNSCTKPGNSGNSEKREYKVFHPEGLDSTSRGILERDFI